VSEYGLSGPLLHAVWHGVSDYVTWAVPATLVPTSGARLLDHNAALDLLLYAVRYSAAALVLLGFWRWLRLRLDVTVFIVPLYLAETLPYPFINERRVALLLPLVAAWYVLGWVVVGDALRRLVSARRRPVQLRTAAVLPAVVLVPLLAWQFPRDYLLHLGESTPSARGSGYVAALRELTPPGWSIATGYQWTMAELTGRTATNAPHMGFRCPNGPVGDTDAFRRMLVSRRVATVLDAEIKWPDNMDSACVLATMRAADWAVPVYHGSDTSTVFLVLGPGTSRDGAEVAVDLPTPSAAVALPQPRRLTEVSVVLARGAGTARVEVRRPDGRWTAVAVRMTGTEPRLVHARFATPVVATAVRVVGVPAGRLRDLVVLASTR